MRSSRSDVLVLPSEVFIYEDPSAQNVDWGELQRYLEEQTGIRTRLRPEFFVHHASEKLDELAYQLAHIKVRNLRGEGGDFEPLLGEVSFESGLLRDPRRRLPGILYDGYRFLELLRSLIPPRERTLRTLHIVATSRLLATLDPADRLYHARVIVCGFPCALSMSGVVEGPAKPREFYLAKRGFSTLGIVPPTEVLKDEIRGRFIDYDDERMTDVLKGYVLQAFFYHITGDPFCQDPECRLFNAHWQEEMIRAQVISGRLCDTHSALLKELKRA